MLPYNRKLKQYSRQLRGSMTDAERRLWTKIRMKQLKGYQFYRQKPIGDYIVDFFCPGAKLVIEIDGSHHLVGETIEHDRIDVLTNIAGVVESIEEEIPGGIPLSPPFPKGETRKLLPFVKGEREGF